MRCLRFALLAAVLAVPAATQPAAWLEDFSQPELGSRWQRDVSRQGTMAVDVAHQVLVLGGKENVFNHLETDLPADVTSVQADFNNVNDPSASWSPSLVLYWGPQSYLRVMVSLHYGLRLETAPGAQIEDLPQRARPVPDTWYRLRLRLTPTTVSLTLQQPGSDLSESKELPRRPEWTGPCRLILGKGYMPREGGNADFDNDYGRGDRNVTVHIDNVVVGEPAGLAERLAASEAAARVTGAHDATQLHVALWPNVLSDRTRDTLWLAEGAYQRVCLIYENRDAAHSARQVSLELEASEHLAPEELIAGSLATEVRRSREGGRVRLVLSFPRGFVLPAGFGGVDRKGGTAPGWLSWPLSPMMPPVFVHCRPTSRQEGVLRARLVSEGKPGPWTEVRAVVLPPLPPLPQADRRHLGLSLWQGTEPALDSGRGRALLADLLRQYQQVGLRRLHVSSREPVFDLAHKLGLHANLMSWWDYSAQCPQDVVPAPEERATDPNLRYTTICPEVIGAGAGSYGRFLETLTARMRQSEADGFMLDYECKPPLCYCARCREAFVRYAGLQEVAWPADVKQGGRYYRQWLDFRCDQGARYVKVIGEAARRAKPDCALQAWVAGYDYAGTIESAQIDISKAARWLTEPEVPHYTLPDSYEDMWTRDAGNGSIEMGLKTVQDSLNVTDRPLVFCSTVIYPLGSATPWSDPDLLNAQMLAMIGQGVRGISFWGGHDDGAVDGRFLHLLAKWNAVLAAADPFLWDGKRVEAAAVVRTADANLLRPYVWTKGQETLVFLVNLTQQERRAEVTLPGRTVRELLSRRLLSLSEPLAVPPLDGVLFVAGAGR